MGHEARSTPNWPDVIMTWINNNHNTGLASYKTREHRQPMSLLHPSFYPHMMTFPRPQRVDASPGRLCKQPSRVAPEDICRSAAAILVNKGTAYHTV
jgi:hypothetical protein